MLLLCGQASAGVDIDFLSGSPGETLTARVPFRLVANDSNCTAEGGREWTGRCARQVLGAMGGGRQVVVTVGDSRHPLRLVVQDGQVVVTSLNDTLVVLGPVTAGPMWHTAVFTLDAAAGSATVGLDAQPPRTVALGGQLQAVWMYLGEGYRDDDVTEQTPTVSSPPTANSCVQVNLTLMSTSVSHST